MGAYRIFQCTKRPCTLYISLAQTSERCFARIWLKRTTKTWKLRRQKPRISLKRTTWLYEVLTEEAHGMTSVVALTGKEILQVLELAWTQLLPVRHLPSDVTSRCVTWALGWQVRASRGSHLSSMATWLCDVSEKFPWHLSAPQSDSSLWFLFTARHHEAEWIKYITRS